MRGEVVERFLSSNGIPFQASAENRWTASLRGERKLAIPLQIAIVGDAFVLESFFMRRPQENVAGFYELLLKRNLRAYGVHFALDATGDVYLVAHRSAEGLDDAELDRIVGALLVEADGLFDAAIEIGFASYLEADRRWRAAQAGGEA